MVRDKHGRRKYSLMVELGFICNDGILIDYIVVMLSFSSPVEQKILNRQARLRLSFPSFGTGSFP